MYIPNLKEDKFAETRPAKKPEYLNEMQWDFCEYYLQTGEIAESVRKAGYAVKYAGNTGTQLMKNPKIKKYLEERFEQMDAAKVANTNEIFSFLTSVMRGEVKDQFDLDVSVSDKMKAADMLLKRTYDGMGKVADVVNIINDIPKTKKKHRASGGVRVEVEYDEVPNETEVGGDE